MVAKIASGNVHINAGLQHLFDFNWLYGFVLSIAAYWTLNLVSPAKQTLIPEVVPGTASVVQGITADMDSETQASACNDEKTMKTACSTECCV